MAGVSMKDIKSRIKSMESTKQITKAMEMVAASKLRGAQERAIASRPYFEVLYQTMHDIADADAPFYAAHMDRLTHMHLHDTAGKKNHLPLGAGELNWREKIALAEAHHARAVVEVKTPAALRDSVATLRFAGCLAVPEA